MMLNKTIRSELAPGASPASADDSSRRRRWLGSRAYWLCQCAGWLGVVGNGVFFWYTQNGHFMVTMRTIALLPEGLLCSHLLRLLTLYLKERLKSWLLVPCLLISILF